MTMECIKTCDDCGDNENGVVIMCWSSNAKKILNVNFEYEHLCEYCAKNFVKKYKVFKIVKEEFIVILSSEDWEDLTPDDIEED